MISAVEFGLDNLGAEQEEVNNNFQSNNSIEFNLLEQLDDMSGSPGKSKHSKPAKSESVDQEDLELDRK